MKPPSAERYGFDRPNGGSMSLRANFLFLPIASVLVGGLLYFSRVDGVGVAYAQPSSPSGSPTVLLENPGLTGWAPEFPGEKNRWRSTPSPGYTHLALPSGFMTPVFDRVEKPRKVIGRVRRGSALSIRKAKTQITCYSRKQRGFWYEVEGGGVLCSRSGFKIVKAAKPLRPKQRDPVIKASIPFEYARVVTSGTPRLRRRPTLKQWNALKTIGGPKDDPSGLMIERMVGDFFVSLDREVEIEGKKFMRTVRNEFVAMDALKPKAPPVMRGERLGRGLSLPLAFVYGEDHTEVLCQDSQATCGVAEKHARFKPEGYTRVKGERYAKAPNNLLVPTKALRILRTQARPGGVGPSEKWIHVDLARQGIVAYEGDQPVYATLISSGKEGHDTPSGLYRVKRKFIAKTMRAIDPKEGLYHIEDIPYIMYYHGGYALHGAFWHDTFGNVRSHGCTNLPPADARWLFHWSNPDVPNGWQASENIKNGTAIYFTNTTNRPS